MGLDDGGFDDDDEIPDESPNVQKITPNVEKSKILNYAAHYRDMDSMKLKFNRVDVKKSNFLTEIQDGNMRANDSINESDISISPHEQYSLMDSMDLNQTMVHHDITEVWCRFCFDMVKESQKEIHPDKCRPLLPNIDTLEAKGQEVDRLPYIDEKIFKVSKAVTNHLSELNKKSEALFQNNQAVKHLSTLRDRAEEVLNN